MNEMIRRIACDKEKKRIACYNDDTWCRRTGRSVGNSVLKGEKEIKVVFVACHGDWCSASATKITIQQEKRERLRVLVILILEGNWERVTKSFGGNSIQFISLLTPFPLLHQGDSFLVLFLHYKYLKFMTNKYF